MIDLGNYARIRALLKDSPGAFVPVPARYVGELMLTDGVTHWRDPETGVDEIEKVSFFALDKSIVIEGPRSICSYGPEETVLVQQTQLV
jgi:hypothetical protein